MGKEHGRATIALIIGTSSSGKSTIIKAMKQQDEEAARNARAKGENYQSINWQEDGLDIASKRFPSLLEMHKQIIRENVDSKKKFEVLTEALGADIRVLEMIWLGTEEKLKEYVKSHSLDVKSKLEDLIQQHRKAFEDASKVVPSRQEIVEDIFARSVNNSKEGKPTVLDMIPLGDYDVIGEFNKYMARQKFSCPLVVIVAYCDVPQIVEHMDRRTQTNILSYTAIRTNVSRCRG